MTQVLHEPARVTHAATMEAAVVTDFGQPGACTPCWSQQRNQRHSSRRQAWCAVAEPLSWWEFYTRGLVEPFVTRAHLDETNDILSDTADGRIAGRVVIDYRTSYRADIGGWTTDWRGWPRKIGTNCFGARPDNRTSLGGVQY